MLVDMGCGAGRFGGFCPDVETFDADIFRFPPAEAAATDPAHRILMEQTMTALFDAEHHLSSKLSPATGVTFSPLSCWLTWIMSPLA